MKFARVWQKLETDITPYEQNKDTTGQSLAQASEAVAAARAEVETADGAFEQAKPLVAPRAQTAAQKIGEREEAYRRYRAGELTFPQFFPYDQAAVSAIAAYSSAVSTVLFNQATLNLKIATYHMRLKEEDLASRKHQYWVWAIGAVKSGDQASGGASKSNGVWLTLPILGGPGFGSGAPGSWYPESAWHPSGPGLSVSLRRAMSLRGHIGRYMLRVVNPSIGAAVPAFGWEAADALGSFWLNRTQSQDFELDWSEVIRESEGSVLGPANPRITEGTEFVERVTLDQDVRETWHVDAEPSEIFQIERDGQIEIQGPYGYGEVWLSISQNLASDRKVGFIGYRTDNGVPRIFRREAIQIQDGQSWEHYFDDDGYEIISPEDPSPPVFSSVNGIIENVSEQTAESVTSWNWRDGTRLQLSEEDTTNALTQRVSDNFAQGNFQGGGGTFSWDELPEIRGTAVAFRWLTKDEVRFVLGRSECTFRLNVFQPSLSDRNFSLKFDKITVNLDTGERSGAILTVDIEVPAGNTIIQKQMSFEPPSTNQAIYLHLRKPQDGGVPVN